MPRFLLPSVSSRLLWIAAAAAGHNADHTAEDDDHFFYNASGTPLQGPVRALAFPRAPVYKDNDPSWLKQAQVVETWPLSRSMGRIGGLIAQSVTDLGGARFEGEDATRLRGLRVATASAPPDIDFVPPWIFVREGCGPSYALLVRDELPDAFGQAFAGFLDVGWGREPLP